MVNLDRSYRYLALILLTLHVAAIISFSIVVPATRPLRRFFRPYINLSGQMQRWTMFSRQEFWQRMEFTLIAEDQNHASQEFGPVLPALDRAGEKKLWLRKFLFALATGLPQFETRTDSYSQNACRQIRKLGSITPTSISFKIHGESITPIESTLAGAPPLRALEIDRGPYKCL